MARHREDPEPADDEQQEAGPGVVVDDEGDVYRAPVDTDDDTDDGEARQGQ